MQGYIFDLDGTLFDSMGVWEQIDKDFLKKRGIGVPGDYIQAISALTLPEAASYTIARFNLAETVPQLLHEWHTMAVDAYSHTVALKPYGKAFLLKLKQGGKKLAIATSAPPGLYLPALKNHDILHLFDAICDADEVGAGKTSPDIFLLAAQKLGLPPCECTVFEDILPGIQSAKSIGMTVYGVYDHSNQKDWEAIQKTAHGTVWDFKAFI